MSNVNTAAVSGNLTADPELKTVKANGEDFDIVNLRLANNRSRKVGDDWVEEASFFDVTVFGKFGSLVDRKMRVGDPLTVVGRLEQQRWEKDGEKRSKVVIIADTIDSPAFFKKDEDVKAKADAGTSTAAPAAVENESQKDDIPF